MAIDYIRLKEKAEKLITENGAVIKVYREGTDATWTRKFDITTSRPYWEDGAGNIVYVAPAGVKTEYEGNCVLSNWASDLLEQGLVQIGDMRATVTIDLELVIGDIMVFGSGKEMTLYPPITKKQPDGVTTLVQVVNARG